jgi:hypothetical protein
MERTHLGLIGILELRRQSMTKRLLSSFLVTLTLLFLPSNREEVVLCYPDR